MSCSAFSARWSAARDSSAASCAATNAASFDRPGLPPFRPRPPLPWWSTSEHTDENSGLISRRSTVSWLALIVSPPHSSTALRGSRYATIGPRASICCANSFRSPALARLMQKSRFSEYSSLISSTAAEPPMPRCTCFTNVAKRSHRLARPPGLRKQKAYRNAYDRAKSRAQPSRHAALARRWFAVCSCVSAMS